MSNEAQGLMNKNTFTKSSISLVVSIIIIIIIFSIINYYLLLLFSSSKETPAAWMSYLICIGFSLDLMCIWAVQCRCAVREVWFLGWYSHKLSEMEWNIMILLQYLLSTMMEESLWWENYWLWNIANNTGVRQKWANEIFFTNVLNAITLLALTVRMHR